MKNLVFKKAENIVTFTYIVNYRKKQVYVDIVSFGNNHHEAWIYVSSYGMKCFMFGNGYSDLKEFEKLVMDNFKEYADSHWNLFCI